jgi:hypothetical protein
VNAFALRLLVALLALLVASARDAQADEYFSSGGACAPPHCYRTAPGRPPDNNWSSSGADVTPYTGQGGGWQPSLSTSPYGYPQSTQPRSPGDGSYVPPHDRRVPDRSYKKNWGAGPDMTPYNNRELQPSFKDRPPSSPPDYPGGTQHPYPSGGSTYVPPHFRHAPGHPQDNNWRGGPNATPYTSETWGWQPSSPTTRYAYPQGTQPR